MVRNLKRKNGVTGLVLQICRKAVVKKASKPFSPGRDWGESYEKHVNFRAKCKLKILLLDASKIE